MMRLLYVLTAAGLIVCAGCSEKAGELDAEDQRHPSAQKAKVKVDSGEYAAAVDYYKEALLDNPNLARVHLDLALLVHRIEEGRDYVAAIYHYRKYLELRPKSEKRKMIENRIRMASQAYAGKVLGSTSGNQPIIKDLEEKNKVLAEHVKMLEEKNRLLKARILQKGRDSSVSFESKRTENSGKRTYTVQHGDTLESIALFFYKDATKAAVIFEDNRSILKGSKGLIPGQILTIP